MICCRVCTHPSTARVAVCAAEAAEVYVRFLYMARLQVDSQPIAVSLPPHLERSGWRNKELTPLPSPGKLAYSDEDDSEEERENYGEEDHGWLLEGCSPSYGTVPRTCKERLNRESSRVTRRHRRTRGKRRHFHSTTIASITSLTEVHRHT